MYSFLFVTSSLVVKSSSLKYYDTCIYNTIFWPIELRSH